MKLIERSFMTCFVGSKSWGSCKPVCRQRCLPTCNLVCCIAPPYAVPRKVAKRLEKQLDTGYARKKSVIKKHVKKKKTVAKKFTKKKNITSKYKNRSVCTVSCQKACLPSCEFRCCMTPKEVLKENWQCWLLELCAMLSLLFGLRKQSANLVPRSHSVLPWEIWVRD